MEDIAGRIMKDTSITKRSWDKDVVAVGTELIRVGRAVTSTSQDSEGLYALRNALQEALHTVDNLLEASIG